MVNQRRRPILHGIGWRVLAVVGGAGLVGSIWLSPTRGFMPMYFLVLLPTAAMLPLAAYLVMVHEGRLSPGRVMALVALYLTLTVVLTDWPFRMVLRLSRPALRRAAQALDSGAPPAASLGWFPVQRVDERAGATAYWTALDPSGYTGLVYSPSGDLPFNVGSSRDLGEGWYFLCED